MKKYFHIFILIFIAMSCGTLEEEQEQLDDEFDVNSQIGQINNWFCEPIWFQTPYFLNLTDFDYCIEIVRDGSINFNSKGDTIFKYEKRKIHSDTTYLIINESTIQRGEDSICYYDGIRIFTERQFDYTDCYKSFYLNKSKDTIDLYHTQVNQSLKKLHNLSEQDLTELHKTFIVNDNKISHSFYPNDTTKSEKYLYDSIGNICLIIKVEKNENYYDSTTVEVNYLSNTALKNIKTTSFIERNMFNEFKSYSYSINLILKDNKPAERVYCKSGDSIIARTEFLYN